MITLKDCLSAYSISDAALDVINKVIFNPRKAYTVSYDDRSYFDFGPSITTEVKKIAGKILNRTFKFKPTRKIVKKAKLNKIRDIYLSTWDDKIVETWLNKSLNILLKDWFTSNSYAYRTEELGLDSCQNSISKFTSNNTFFIKRDISKYFYSIDKNTLLNQLESLIDKNDFLYKLIEQRVNFEYVDKDGSLHQSEIGIPFGSPLACTLSNIHITHIDKGMSQFKVKYFRYADDVLIMSKTKEDALKAAEYFDNEIDKLKLKLKPTHKLNFSWVEAEGFEKVTQFSHLGLVYKSDGKIKLAVEKQRKIINFVDRELKKNKNRIKKLSSLDDKIKHIIEAVNNILNKRIRSAAIIDYYLKHVNDELQLKVMDRIITEKVISTILDKPFRKKLFREIPYKKLRDFGLQSLVHRNRLFRHGHLHVAFLSLHNKALIDRYNNSMNRRKEKIDQIKLAKKLKQIKNTV